MTFSPAATGIPVTGVAANYENDIYFEIGFAMGMADCILCVGVSPSPISPIKKYDSKEIDGVPVIGMPVDSWTDIVWAG